MMWATGAHVVPTSATDDALRDGDIKGVLEILHKMWTEGLMPEAVRGAGPSEFSLRVLSWQVGNVCPR